ncbi:MAG: glycosyltransferase family 2 protein [Cyclobacteriaceae bacterium]
MKNLLERFKEPNWMQDHMIEYSDWREVPTERLGRIKEGLARFTSSEPLVTICIPVWNEADNLLKTLSSLSAIDLPYPTELLFVNNNSTDETVDILESMGLRVVHQPKQGIAHARLMGLQESRGVYSLCGDGDTIYPTNWIKPIVTPLMKSAAVKCVYGFHAYAPTGNGSRIPWACYELASFGATLMRKFKREFLNVHGCNFAFRTVEGLHVKGFEMALTRTFDSDRHQSDHVVFGEDGRMGRKLGELGKLKLVTDFSAVAWTSARRLLREDGTMFKAFTSRAKLELSLMGTYLFGPAKVPNTSDDITTSATSISK